ncbi:peptide deformylase [Paenibacillus sp. D9]|uniref:peptide deformylase n=1 Tax=Paenibacillus sp. D9 TaxID=665792 RepID=UPI00061E6B52|nr:peptide deformylase [Paenibacillus sp. D9]KKC46822.1 peptide deformylase [Paenibacillus sp. D9]
MAVKEILPFGDPILRRRAREVDSVDERTIRYLDSLAETLYAREGRAGLAAPQVGILRRLIVMDCGEGLIELINPEIIHREGQQTGAEGCLSLPGYYGNVTRSQKVQVRTLNRSGETVVLHGEGYLARCMQHEIDHLDGILYVDHVRDSWLTEEHTGRKANLLPILQLSRRT